MNKTPIQTLLAMILLVALAGCGLLPATDNLQTLTASGAIQVDSIRLAAEQSGKITAVAVKEGDPVKAGEVLFRLDDTALQSQRKQASAALQAALAAQAAAQANLDLLKAGATAEQLRAAQAQVDQAEANRQAAQAALWSGEGSARPEEVDAAQARLDRARNAYLTLTAALTGAQIDATQAVLSQAESNLSQIQDQHDRLAQDKRTPPNGLEAASVAIADAQAAVDYATQAGQAVADDSQPLYLQIASVHKTWAVAQLNQAQAQARLDALQREANMLPEALDAARSVVDESQSLADLAQKAYESLNSSGQADRLKSAWDELQKAQTDFNAMGRSDPGAAGLEALTQALNAATAQRNLAQANYDSLKNGPRPEQVAAAQAQLDAAKAGAAQAQATLDSIDVQIQKMAVAAPSDGVILTRALDAGEIAQAGATVIEMGNLDQVTLKVYVPEDQYGKIKLGQAVSVRVDSFPGRVFDGTVSFISDQAEYTPRNVQTQETRSTTVYAIEIRLPNPDHVLKPGMPADATF